MRERLTVVVPTYNRVRYLGECLQSIVAQTLRDFKIVVLDNASDEDVVGVLRSVADPRVSVIRNPFNVGSVANIQKALDLASTEFVTVFHDDDYMHAELLETQIGIFDEVPGLAFVATSCNMVYDDSQIAVFSSVWQAAYEILRTPSELISALVTQPFGFSGTMFRTSATKEVRLDIARFSIACDRPFLVSLTEKGACAYLKQPTYNARQHLRQDSAALVVDRYFEVFGFYREQLNCSGDPAAEACFNYVVTRQLIRIYLHGLWNRQFSMSALFDWSFSRGLISAKVFAHYGIMAVAGFIPRKVCAWTRRLLSRLPGTAVAQRK